MKFAKLIFFKLWLVVYLITAQEEVKSFLVDTYKYDYVLNEKDIQGNSYYFFSHKNKFEIKILDNNFNLIGGRTFKLKDFNKNLRPLGLSNDANYVYVFFYDYRNNYISRLSYDKKNIAMPRISGILTLPENEKFVSSFNNNGDYKILTLNGETNEFIIRSNKSQFDSSSKIRIKSDAVLTQKILQNGERNIYLTKIFNYTDRIEFTNTFSKLYCTSGKVLITVDQFKSTHIFTIDLSANTCKYNQLFFHLQNINDADIKGANSFIKDDRLFHVSLGSNVMNVSVVDLTDFSLVKNYNLKSSSETIDLESETAVIEIEYEDRSDTRNYVRNPSDFIDYLDNDALAIAVTENSDSEYLVQVGSSKITYYTVSSPEYGPNFGMGSSSWGISTGGGFGGFGSPNVLMPTSNTYKKNTKVYFKSILSKDDLRKSSSTQFNQSLYTKIKIFENQRVNTAYNAISTLLENENEIIYGYFSGKDDLYHLIKFSNKNEN